MGRQSHLSLILVAILTLLWGRAIVTGQQSGSMKLNPKDGLEYAWIPPGGFQMGCVSADEQCEGDEKPRHPVEITKGFWMGRTEVTVRAYRKFVQDTEREMPKAFDFFNPGWEDTDHPMVNVTWHDSEAYCEWAGGRLPTEAEWEYAARGGKEGLKYPWGNEITHDDANFSGKGGRDNRDYTAPVGSFPPNGYGLYDMAGNVWEWCADWYRAGYYRSLPEDEPSPDPLGPSSSLLESRVLRGGGWDFHSEHLRSSIRFALPIEMGGSLIAGFRCVREVSP